MIVVEQRIHGLKAQKLTAQGITLRLDVLS